MSSSIQVHSKEYLCLSSGFLDPDELSSMIEAVHKGGKQMLPGIQEEIHRSTESISTLGSDTLTLESIEADLFEDIRASIQKSSTASKMERTKAGSALAETKISSGICTFSYICSSILILYAFLCNELVEGWK